jgi:D-amino-acid dehydrogenase
MKVIIIGGGVVAVSTAYYLARAGCKVTVLEEKEALGLEATSGNAGIIASGHSFAWASPAAPGMLWRSLRGDETAIRVRLKPDLDLATWGVRFLRECTAARARRNTLVKLRLSQYSQAVMTDLVRREGIEFQAINRGALYLYRDAAALQAGAARMALLGQHGQTQEVLDAAGVARLEPAFAPAVGKIAGAVRDVGDSSGDARLFTENLARVAQDTLGVTIQLNARASALLAAGDRIDGVVTGQGTFRADSYVLAAGVHSPVIARTAGVRLPIYPAKGYSCTFPLTSGGLAPTVPGVDDQWFVGWSRLGDRLRLTSTAEFAGYDWGWTPRDFANILRFARDIFPDAADYARGQYRACLRPMTPDGPPILGVGRHRNLYFNAGHGSMGWTWACGTGKIVADLMAGRMPDIDLDGLTAGRG